MIKHLTLFLLLISTRCLAQYTITGSVTGKADKKPVSFATVFLNNTSVATATDDNGKFTLKNVRPGHYQLTVRFIGYEHYKNNITVDGNLNIPAIELATSNETLTEVDVKGKRRLSGFFNEFKREFLGTTDFAKQCQILNPFILHFNYDGSSKTLHVTSNRFLEIENDALGYKIRYIVDNFTKDETNGVMFYEGPSYFEDLKGTPEQQQQWHKNRMHAYTGSVMEFLRSLATNKMERNGYEVRKLYRVPNPYWDRQKDGTSNMYIQKIIDTVLYRDQFMKLTHEKGLYAITSPADTCLYVRYVKHNDLVSAYEKTIFRREDARYAITSIIAFKQQYAFFDDNGVIVNPASVLFEGYFSENRVGNQLPDDFEPTK